MDPSTPFERRFWQGALQHATLPQRREQSLTGLTHRWLRELPPSCRPEDLCRRHPGLANRVARCWGERDLCVQLLEDFAEDPGGHGDDLPLAVRAELRQLRDLRTGRMPLPRASWLQRCMRRAGLH